MIKARGLARGGGQLRMRVVRASAQDKQAGQEADIAEKLHKCLMLPRSCTSVCSLPTETKGQARAHGARQWQPHPGPAPLLAAAESIERGGAGRGGRVCVCGNGGMAERGREARAGGAQRAAERLQVHGRDDQRHGPSPRRRQPQEKRPGMVRRPAAASRRSLCSAAALPAGHSPPRRRSHCTVLTTQCQGTDRS